MNCCGIFSTAFQRYCEEYARAIAPAITSLESALPINLRDIIIAFLTPLPTELARSALPALCEPEWLGWNIYFSRRRESPDKLIAIRFVFPPQMAPPFILRVGVRELDNLPALVSRILPLCATAEDNLTAELLAWRLKNHLDDDSVYDFHNA